MKGQIKQILTALKKAGVSPEILAILGIAVILGFIIYKVWSSRKSAAEDKEKAPAAAPDAQPAAAAVKKVPKDRFTAIWARFRKELPPVVRRSLGNFAPFVVMGTDPAAAARLINGYTDWERQARFLFGSHVDDPNLKIYLGSKVLVLDMPESVLSETSSSARVALLRLWRPLFRRRTPTVVVAISPTKLAGLRPEQIGDLADTIRGKVNLLSWVRKKPIEVRVALTNLDEIPGFEELAGLADRNNLPLTIDVAEGTSDYELEGQLNERFSELYRFLQLGLTDLPSTRFAGHFTELVGFLRNAPAELSPQIATFLAALMVRQPLGEQPILRKIHLTAPDGNAGPASPFTTQHNVDSGRGPLFWHRFAAIGVAAILGLGLISGYYYERSLYVPAKKALDKYMVQDLEKQGLNEPHLRSQISQFANRTTFPGFFAHAQEQMQGDLRKRILEMHINSRLQSALEHSQGLRAAIHLLALAYASSETDLGRAMTENSEMAGRWSKATGLPTDVLLDYVVAAERPNLAQIHKFAEPEALLKRRFASSRYAAAGAWQQFFEETHRLLQQDTASRMELQETKDQAAPLISELARIQQYPDAGRLLDLVSDADPELKNLRLKWGRNMLEKQRPKVFGDANKRAKIGRFLASVVRTDFSETPEVDQLHDLCRWLDRTLTAQQRAEAREELGILGMFTSTSTTPGLVHFRVDSFAIQESDWLRLTRDNTVRDALRDFEVRAGSRDGLFFARGTAPPSLELNRSTKGRYLFAGKATIPGRFTMEAVDNHIVPPLECLGHVWPRTRKIAPQETAEIDRLLQRHLENYAVQYERYLTDYYRAFRLRADGSVDSLRAILARLQRGDSPFTQHLIKVARNSRLPEHGPFTRTYLEPLKAGLESFEALQGVATSTMAEGVLGKYLVIVAQVQEKMEPDPFASGGLAAPAAPATEAAPAATLGERLSPAGQMALQMLTCSKDSPLIAIEALLADVKLPRELHGPFLTLARELYLVGRRNIEHVTAEVWSQEIITSVQGLTLRFPFLRRSDTDVTPEQLTDVLHPTTGRFVRVRQTYLDPISAIPAGCNFRYAREAPLPPPGATLMMPKLTALSGRLWDADGQPQALEFVVRPVEFQSKLRILRTDGEGYVEPSRYLEDLMTLTFISSGATTLVNFNQRPFASQLKMDWTVPHLAQVGVRLTNPETRDETLPDRLGESSNWALLRLLARAAERDGVYTWQVPYTADATGSQRKPVRAEVSFEIPENPFALFELSDTLKAQARLHRINGATR